MTEPVQGIARLGTVGRRGEMQKKQHSPYVESDHEEASADNDDTVEISDEARKRASGKYRKNILEHIEEDE